MRLISIIEYRSLHFVSYFSNIVVAFMGGGFGDTGYGFFFIGDYEDAVLRHRLLVLFWQFTVHATSKYYDNTAFSLKEDFKYITFHFGVEATDIGNIFLLADLHCPIEGWEYGQCGNLA